MYFPFAPPLVVHNRNLLWVVQNRKVLWVVWNRLLLLVFVSSFVSSTVISNQKSVFRYTHSAVTQIETDSRRLLILLTPF